MMDQTEEREVVKLLVLVVMIKVSYLTGLYFNIAGETKAYAAATARKQNNLILSVSWNGNSCLCRSPALFLFIVAGQQAVGHIFQTSPSRQLFSPPEVDSRMFPHGLRSSATQSLSLMSLFLLQKFARLASKRAHSWQPKGYQTQLGRYEPIVSTPQCR
jgi:hypothetical protein